MQAYLPDDLEFWRQSDDPPAVNFTMRLRLAWRLLCGGSVVHRAKFGVSNGQLWLIQRKDKAPTSVYGTKVYNRDTYQNRLLVSGPNWVNTTPGDENDNYSKRWFSR